MPRIGLEPTHLTAPEPKSGVSTNFTTWAGMKREFNGGLRFCQSGSGKGASQAPS